MSYPPYYCTTPAIAGTLLAVVVTCHAAYLDRLPACIEAIDRQGIRAEKILCLDGCEYQAPHDWSVINGVWREPNPARNVGWQLAASKGVQWVIFWDADNLMPEGYLHNARQAIHRARISTGIISPDIIRGQSGQVRFVSRFPCEWSHWAGRANSISDTASAWKVEALHQTGGFSDGNTMLDDYTLALAITRLGWGVESMRTAVWLEDGETRSTKPERGLPDLWHNRSFHVVTLLAGRHDILRRWLESVHRVELPKQTHWTLVDDSQCSLFAAELERTAELLQRLPHVRSVRVITAPPKSGGTAWEDIHRRVAALYNMALAGTNHDMVLLWEDDVIASDRDSLKRLHAGFTPFSRLGAVGAVYPQRGNKDVAVASLDSDRWGLMPRIDALQQAAPNQDRFHVGMLGGGLTLWAGHALNPLLPLQTVQDPRLGWDGYLSREANRAGWRLELDLRVNCDHLV